MSAQELQLPGTDTLLLRQPEQEAFERGFRLSPERPASRASSLFKPRTYLVFALAFVALIMLQSFRTAEVIDCRRPPLALQLGSKVEVAMAVASGMSCPVIVRAADAALDGLSVEMSPQHGNIVPRGRTGVSYRAAPGFRGEDFFAFSLKGRSRNTAGTMLVWVRVAVR
jgi:hypothetical protein